MTITVKPNNAGYVNISEPWNAGQWHKEQTEQEKRKIRELSGQKLEINQKTYEMLSEIESPKIIPYKGYSLDNSVSKVLTFYNNHKKVGDIEKIDKDKITEEFKLRKGDDFTLPKNDDLQTIHIEYRTFETLEHVRKSFFPPFDILAYYYDPVLQVCIKYYMDNNPEYKRQKKA